MKIIYISYLPLTKFTFENDFIKDFIINGYEVEYWDLSKIFNTNYCIELYNSDIINFFSNYKVLIQKIKNNKDAKYIILNTFNRRLVFLYFILQYYGCFIIKIANWSLPQYTKPLKNKKITIKKLLIYIYDKSIYLIKLFHFIKSPNITFVSGQRGIMTNGIGYKLDLLRGINININSRDYEKYKSIEKNKPIISGDYIVFLDQYLPHHPDFKLLNELTVSSEKYYSSLKHFFEYIEKKLKMPVIISLHPKADENKVEYGNRFIIKNHTEEIVKDSKLVIAHNSTSIDFAIISYKPILLITNNEINTKLNNFYHSMLSISKLIDTKFINIDDKFNLPANIFNVNFIKYNIYIYDYMTSISSEHKKSFEIIEEKILNL